MNDKEAVNILHKDNTCGNELLQQSEMLRKYLLIQSTENNSMCKTFIELNGHISMKDDHVHETGNPSLLCQSNLQTDTEEKSYSCEVCGKAYSKIYMNYKTFCYYRSHILECNIQKVNSRKKKEACD
ncbi:hypothetical protein HNY73_014724 [Argiope bruennichi]|uniref:C2H2-type domain-containing protein n=1 Tax=Argiope bruennichi TaxID=94029 RepID=A0A8T0ERQ2_ARGBR|nr:hypothetical protein HNY73_014724 [Argiope bruennichi]